MSTTTAIPVRSTGENSLLKLRGPKEIFAPEDFTHDDPAIDLNAIELRRTVTRKLLDGRRYVD